MADSLLKEQQRRPTTNDDENDDGGSQIINRRDSKIRFLENPVFNEAHTDAAFDDLAGVGCRQIDPTKIRLDIEEITSKLRPTAEYVDKWIARRPPPLDGWRRIGKCGAPEKAEVF